MPQVRVNKEQDHVLISPQGLSYAEVTGANLVSGALFVVIATHGKITLTPRVILVNRPCLSVNNSINSVFYHLAEASSQSRPLKADLLSLNRILVLVIVTGYANSS